MLSQPTKKEFYRALVHKDADYEGHFFVGIKTTGIFCRPTCPARKPKFENCEFFNTAQQALLASYRPCKRCKPLGPPNETSSLVNKLINLVEQEPEKRWKSQDLRALKIDPSTARRHFKARFGMSFIEYARAKRLSIAMNMIRKGSKVIDAQVNTDFDSSSGFRDAFSKIMDNPPVKSKEINIYHSSWVDTALGPMIAIADDEALVLLEFIERRGLELEIKQLRSKEKCAILPGSNKILKQIENELKSYFSGKLKAFKTPIKMVGTPFQKKVWQALLEIPWGTTISYAQLAKNVGNPNAFRAVANANGKNQLALIIPCHRVINSNGNIGGYGGGIKRKEWLIKLENCAQVQT